MGRGCLRDLRGRAVCRGAYRYVYASVRVCAYRVSEIARGMAAVGRRAASGNSPVAMAFPTLDPYPRPHRRPRVTSSRAFPRPFPVAAWRGGACVMFAPSRRRVPTTTTTTTTRLRSLPCVPQNALCRIYNSSRRYKGTPGFFLGKG